MLPLRSSVAACAAIKYDSLLPGEASVWFQSTGHLGESEVTRLIEYLSPCERERCLQFRFARDRRDFAAAHVLLRATLSRYEKIAPLAWEFETDGHGKPSIAHTHCTDLTFNLSHTHGLVACAVTRGAEIGIDVEPIDRVPHPREIALYCFSQSEITALDRLDPLEYARRFVEMWTLKEAYIKGVGLGLSLALDSFSFLIGANDCIHFSPPPEGGDRQWQFHLVKPFPDFRLALALERTHESTPSKLTFHDAVKYNVHSAPL